MKMSILTNTSRLIVEKLKDFFDYEGDWEPYKAQMIENLTDRVPKTGQLKRKDGMVVNFRYVPLPTEITF